uniref:VPS9 domain-containing protein n=1 Tax=Setaria digitata TaxID=48799 RepID=A0A915PIW0_9BILA
MNSFHVIRINLEQSIGECVSQFAPAGDSHIWTTDDLLPAFVYVTVRAQLQHLGAEIRLIEDFTPQLQGPKMKITAKDKTKQVMDGSGTKATKIVNKHVNNMSVMDGSVSRTNSNNVNSLFLITFVLYTIVTVTRCQQHQRHLFAGNTEDDDLYVLIDEISVYTCRGGRCFSEHLNVTLSSLIVTVFAAVNEIKLTEDDVDIVNEKGNRVYFIKAPGSYSLHFKKLVVTKDFGYLSGEIGVTLQVPIIEGPAGIRFDLPYTVIPETGILDQECDEQSGVIERGNRQYCRYCDICGLTAKLETDLNDKGHLFLPEVARGNEEKFSPVCNRIASNVYEFNRTINLPGRRELEARISEKIQGLDGELRQRLNKKRGRFQVFLNLISAEQPAIRQNDWFKKSADCQCCWDDSSAACRGMLSFLYCSREECKNRWAQRCLHHTARIAACYTIEFNYHTTISYSDVIQFLKENNYPNQESAVNASLTQTPITSEYTLENDKVGHNVLLPLTERCVAKMPERLTHLRRYCIIFWNDKLCCSHCPGTVLGLRMSTCKLPV